MRVCVRVRAYMHAFLCACVRVRRIYNEPTHFKIFSVMSGAGDRMSHSDGDQLEPRESN